MPRKNLRDSNVCDYCKQAFVVDSLARWCEQKHEKTKNDELAKNKPKSA
jgi:hypothetical protein